MSEIEKIYYVDIDITDAIAYSAISFTSGDTLNKIIFNISNNGEPIDNLSLYNYKIFVKRQDGALVCKIPEIVNNRLQYILGTTEIEVAGICKCTLEVYDGLNKITTQGFSFIVTQSLNNTTVTESETVLHIQYDYNDLANKPEINLISDVIVGTTQSISFNTDGSIQKVQHKDSLGNIIREDVFTYETNLITEVRTLANGNSITFKYHLDTLETEVI